MIVDLILGTAGHIDHGKTSLIKALTGVNTDRLPEEKKRGITIELGFAELTLPDAIAKPEPADVRYGIVDVPGHERFVRNMLAGATGIDVALLVVAADDSVKPQTTEHLEILRLLDLRAGVIALTKCDVADADWIDLVETEIREAVADSFLADAPIVKTSAHTGQGLAELKQQLAVAAGLVLRAQPKHRLQGPFRMAIDRSFTIAGHGSVVTGSVVRGTTRVGDELAIEPGGRSVRVRGLQNHDRTVDQVHRGQRAAINIAGVHHDEIGRGHELASPGHLRPSKLISARICLLDSLRKPVRNRAKVRLHIGAKECLATIHLPEMAELGPSESTPAQFFLEEPIVAVWGQPLVLRSESPLATIGGGRVLDPDAEKIRRADRDIWDQLDRLAAEDELTRADAASYFFGLRPWTPDDLARAAGIEAPLEVHAQLVASGVVEEHAISQTRVLRIHRDLSRTIRDRIERVMLTLHEQHPLLLSFEVSRVRSRFDYLPEPALFAALLEQLVAEKRVRRIGQGVALAGQGPQLSKNEVKLFDELLEQFQEAGLETPTVKEIEKSVAKNKDSVRKLVELATAQGELIKISGDYILHRQVEHDLREQMRQLLADGQPRTTSELRESLGTTRKYAIPMFEHFDRTGLTKRVGDARQLADEA